MEHVTDNKQITYICVYRNLFIVASSRLSICVNSLHRHPSPAITFSDQPVLSVRSDNLTESWRKQQEAHGPGRSA